MEIPTTLCPGRLLMGVILGLLSYCAKPVTAAPGIYYLHNDHLGTPRVVTDQQRNVDEALRPILDGLRWLGIDWDEGPDVDGPHAPYYQSQRGERYAAAAEALSNEQAAEALRVAQAHADRSAAKAQEYDKFRETVLKGTEDAELPIWYRDLLARLRGGVQ